MKSIITTKTSNMNKKRMSKYIKFKFYSFNSKKNNKLLYVLVHFSLISFYNTFFTTNIYVIIIVLRILYTGIYKF